MEEAAALTALSALSNEARLRIVKALVQSGSDGMTAGAIAGSIGATPSRASFHLSTLSEAGLVTATRQAREIIYRVEFTAFGALVAYILRDCCGGNEVVMACCQPDCPC